MSLPTHTHRTTVVILLLTSLLASTHACETAFPDIASLTVSAKIIVDAVAEQSGPVEILKNTKGVIFRLNSYLKGNISKTRDETLFAVSSDMGCLDDVILRQRYVIFLNGTRLDFRFKMASRLFAASVQPVVYDEKSQAQVAAFACSDCGKKPKAKIKPASQTIIKNSNIVIKCQVTGSPPPSIVWLRGTAQMSSNKDVVITNDALSSTLLIKSEAASQYKDVYVCQAANVLGTTESDKSYVYSDADDGHAVPVTFFQPCKDQGYCQGHGVCEELIETGKKRCNCSTGYEGTWCESKLYTDIPIKRGAVEIMSIVSILLVSLVLLSLIVILYNLLKLRHEYHTDKKRMRMMLMDDRTSNPNNGFNKSADAKMPTSLYMDEESFLQCPNNRRDDMSASPQELTPFDNDPNRAFFIPSNLLNSPSNTPQLKAYNINASEPPVNKPLLPTPQKYRDPESSQKKKPISAVSFSDANGDYLPRSNTHTIPKTLQPIPEANPILRNSKAEAKNLSLPIGQESNKSGQSPKSKEIKLKEEADAIVNEMLNYTISNSRNSPPKGNAR